MCPQLPSGSEKPKERQDPVLTTRGAGAMPAAMLCCAVMLLLRIGSAQALEAKKLSLLL